MSASMLDIKEKNREHIVWELLLIVGLMMI